METLKEIGGKIEVKGRCYEDIVTILIKNGYNVTVTVSACSNPENARYVIAYSKTDEAELPF